MSSRYVVAPGLKRLRVRLRATDRASLVSTFGGFLAARGAYVISKDLLPPGTPVLLELCYLSGQAALAGPGRVLEVHATGPRAPGMLLEIDWFPSSRPAVEEILAEHEARTRARASGPLGRSAPPDPRALAPGLSRPPGPRSGRSAVAPAAWVEPTSLPPPILEITEDLLEVPLEALSEDLPDDDAETEDLKARGPPERRGAASDAALEAEPSDTLDLVEVVEEPDAQPAAWSMVPEGDEPLEVPSEASDEPVLSAVVLASREPPPTSAPVLEVLDWGDEVELEAPAALEPAALGPEGRDVQDLEEVEDFEVIEIEEELELGDPLAPTAPVGLVLLEVEEQTEPRAALTPSAPAPRAPQAPQVEDVALELLEDTEDDLLVVAVLSQTPPPEVRAAFEVSGYDAVERITTADLVDAVDVIDVLDPEALEEIEELDIEEPVRRLRDLPSTEYAFSRVAAREEAGPSASRRDELGPSPAPRDALASEVAPPPASAPALGEREPGEVTPLARIELVRRTSSLVRPPEAPPMGQAGHEALPPGAIPSKRSRPELPPRTGPIVGIDLGMSKTTAALARGGEARVLLTRTGAASLPSVVMIDPGGKTLVGEHAARRLAYQPSRGIAGTQRLIGKAHGAPGVEQTGSVSVLARGEEGEVALRLGPHVVSLEEITALLLKEVRESATRGAGATIQRAVLTCPSTYGPRQREALRVAAELAGLNVETVVSQTLAAAAWLGREGVAQSERWLVYDLGAGVFDASVIEVRGERLEVLASGGDLGLGGLDFDARVMALLGEELQRIGAASDLGEGIDLTEAAELGKWSVGAQAVAHVQVEQALSKDEVATLELELRRDAAEAAFEPLVERTLELCRELCARAGVKPRALDRLLLVGGQTKSPFVQRRVREAFPVELAALDPMHAVAFGAALLGERIAEGRALPVVERLAASLGVARPGGGLVRVLERGVALPAQPTFTCSADAAEDLELYVFSGDGRSVRDDEPLYCLRLEGLPEDLAPPFEIELCLTLSAAGQLEASAFERRAGPLTATALPIPPREALLARLGAVEGGAEVAEGEVRLLSWLRKKLRGGARGDAARE